MASLCREDLTARIDVRGISALRVGRADLPGRRARFHLSLLHRYGRLPSSSFPRFCIRCTCAGLTTAYKDIPQSIKVIWIPSPTVAFRVSLQMVDTSGFLVFLIRAGIGALCPAITLRVPQTQVHSDCTITRSGALLFQRMVHCG